MNINVYFTMCIWRGKKILNFREHYDGQISTSGNGFKSGTEWTILGQSGQSVFK